MNGQRALVTGGAGFLGSHLCDALLAEGHRVVAVDNLLTGRLANIEHLRNDSRFEFLEHDVCRPLECGRVDHVFHFASPASPVIMRPTALRRCGLVPTGRLSASKPRSDMAQNS
jgi:dTDP-glucose 4,6-dehydratase